MNIFIIILKHISSLQSSMFGCSFLFKQNWQEIRILFFVPGRKQHPSAEGCKRHILQPAVSSAISLQLSQISAQTGAELPAPRLGNEDSPQRTTLFHRSQQQNNHLGEATLPPITQLECMQGWQKVYELNPTGILAELLVRLLFWYD